MKIILDKKGIIRTATRWERIKEKLGLVELWNYTAMEYIMSVDPAAKEKRGPKSPP